MQSELTGRSVSETATTAPAAPAQSRQNMRSIRLVLLSVLLAGAGQLIFKAAVSQLGQLEISVDLFIAFATSPALLLGLAVFGVSAFLWLVALMKADLSFAYPFLSLSYVVVLIGGSLLFAEKITTLRIIGFLVIISGIFIVARGESDS